MLTELVVNVTRKKMYVCRSSEAVPFKQNFIALNSVLR